MHNRLNSIWEETLSIVKGELNAPVFKTWFENTSPLSLSEERLTVSVPSPFAKDLIERRYTALVELALQEVVGERVSIAFTIETGGEDAPAASRDEKALSKPTKGGVSGFFTGTPLNSKYTFDSFVIGNSNRFAHAAALAVAESPHKAYNPLFLYGGVGLGKTHLLQAIAQYVLEQHINLKVKYVSTEKFTNDFINSIRDREKITGFQKRYRDNDVLLVDDIQFLENKEATQEEFFHTFNTLYEADKQIVISCDRPPRDIATLEDRLRSRFEWGLITDIQPPDLETRIAILQKKARAGSLTLPGGVLEFIASRIQTNIRELEGALIRVVAFATLNKKPIDVELTNLVLKDIFPEREIKPITVPKIQSEVCRYYNISKIELLGNKRAQAIAFPRQVAMYLTRELTDLSLPKIGEVFGGRDHTTVLHANTKIEKLINEKREVYNQVQELTRLLK